MPYAFLLILMLLVGACSSPPKVSQSTQKSAYIKGSLLQFSEKKLNQMNQEGLQKQVRKDLTQKYVLKGTQFSVTPIVPSLVESEYFEQPVPQSSESERELVRSILEKTLFVQQQTCFEFHLQPMRRGRLPLRDWGATVTPEGGVPAKLYFSENPIHPFKIKYHPVGCTEAPIRFALGFKLEIFSPRIKPKVRHLFTWQPVSDSVEPAE